MEAVPTYVVVGNSQKEDKKKNKEVAEQKIGDDQYAIVYKSKKKKKNEAYNTYAEVDMSQKSKKKPKLGDVLYVDLGEFHHMKKMLEVSTFSTALPPQYADITQFLMGNPEDPGADLPKDSTIPAVSNTATGSKEESSTGNTGDDAEASKETGF